MPLINAVVTLDHHQAQIVCFNAEKAETTGLHASHHATPQHGSAVREVHEFFHKVCVALDPNEAVLIVGSHTSLSDFRHYVEKHYAALAPRIIGYEPHQAMTANQTVAFARDYFNKHTKLAH